MSLRSIFKKEDPTIKEAKKIVSGNTDSSFNLNPSKATRKANEEAERRRDVIIESLYILKREIYHIDDDLLNEKIENTIDRMRRIQLNGNIGAMEVVDELIDKAVKECINLVNRGAVAGLLRGISNISELVNERFLTLEYFLNPDYLKLYQAKQTMVTNFQSEQAKRADKKRSYMELKQMYSHADESQKREIQNEAKRIEKEVAMIDHEIGIMESSLDVFDEALSACKSGLILDNSPLNIDLSGILNAALDTSLSNKAKLAEISKYKQRFQEARVKGGLAGVTVNADIARSDVTQEKEFEFKEDL